MPGKACLSLSGLQTAIPQYNIETWRLELEAHICYLFLIRTGILWYWHSTLRTSCNPNYFLKSSISGHSNQCWELIHYVMNCPGAHHLFLNCFIQTYKCSYCCFLLVNSFLGLIKVYSVLWCLYREKCLHSHFSSYSLVFLHIVSYVFIGWLNSLTHFQ